MPSKWTRFSCFNCFKYCRKFRFSSIDHGSSDFYHYLIESIRIGFADSLWYITDPAKSDIPTEKLLSKEYAKQRFNEINKESVMKKVSHNTFETSGDTVYITAIDKNGMGCSLINSTFQGFGSGLVVPETGIALQNRGALFSLDKKSSKLFRTKYEAISHYHSMYGH